MKILIITKHLLDLTDAQSQQSLAFVKAMQDIFIKIDVITASTNTDDYLYIQRNIKENTSIFLNEAFFVEKGSSFFQKIQRKIQRNSMAIFPTHWVKSSIKMANALEQKNDYSAILTIGLPIESHMVGLGLLNKNKWIASFSDPWPESIMPKPYSDFSLPVLNFLQKKVVQDTLSSSKFIIFTCDQSRNLFLDHYDFNADKTFIVQHVAPDLIKKFKNNNVNFVITHAGSFSRERYLPELFYAIKELPSDSKLRFDFIGFVCEEAKLLIEKLKINNRIKFLGQLDKDSTLEVMRSSDALLLIEAKMDKYPFLPSKLADYSVFNLPVLAITGKDSAVTEIMNETQSGFVTSHNKNEIFQLLLSIEKETLNIEFKNKLYEYFKKENAQDNLKSIISALNN